MPDFDAIVAANAPHSSSWVAGLTLRERGQRIAERVGARRVWVLDKNDQAGELAKWVDPDTSILFISARDQVVHLDLVEPLIDAEATGERRVAVDDAGYAGALWADADAVAELIGELRDSPADGDATAAERWSAAAATQVRLAEDAIARHKATNAAERKAAARMLYDMIHKGQDGPITRWIYRPVSLPITRMLLHTPITPNQVTMFCAVLSAIGLYLTAQYGYWPLLWGAVLIQTAGLLDCCDGEIARLKVRGSKFGAWLDTVVDEITSVGFNMALGYHVYLHRGDEWIYSLIFACLAVNLLVIYIVYYYIIVIAHSGNSQDYRGKLHITKREGQGLAQLEPVPESAKPRGAFIAWCAEYIPHVLRRDFLCLAALALVAADQAELLYALFLTGSAVAAVVVIPEHLRLRWQLRKLDKLNQTS